MLKIGNVESEFEVKEIITSLEFHLENHRVEYEKAVVVYNKKTEKELKAILKRVRNGEVVNLAFAVPIEKRVPQNEEKRYLETIELFRQVEKTQSTIKMTLEEANCIFNDDWDWSISAKAANSFYSR